MEKNLTTESSMEMDVDMVIHDSNNLFAIYVTDFFVCAKNLKKSCQKVVYFSLVYYLSDFREIFQKTEVFIYKSRGVPENFFEGGGQNCKFLTIY